ncbi:MAG TPA: hypothetical protein VKB39_07390 [Candidatus Baltobacteraceae bacterium]|nr:hypothetical protein [Candidatus Baltobacteraceae bacterium]
MKPRSSLAAMLLCVLTLGATPARTSPPPPLDPCTVVAVEMLESVDSSDARPGDFFRFETVNAVTSGATVVIPARTLGYGVVAVASPAGKQSHPGTLVLEPRYLVLPNGHHVGVVLNHNSDSLQKAGAGEVVPGYLGAIPIPGVGLAIGALDYFHHGHNIVVPRGLIFTVFPSDDPAVERCQDHPQI